jgi:hypothetical protein
LSSINDIYVCSSVNKSETTKNSARAGEKKSARGEPEAGGAGAIASAATISDDMESASSSVVVAAAAAVQVNVPQPLATEDFQKILKTLMLFLPRQGKAGVRGNDSGRAPGNSRGAGSGSGDRKASTEGSPGSARNGGGNGQGGSGGVVAGGDGLAGNGPDEKLVLPVISSRPNTANTGSRPDSRTGSRHGTAKSRSNSVRGAGGAGTKTNDGRDKSNDLINDDEDVLSVNFESYNGANMRPTSRQNAEDRERLRQYDLKSGLGEIWVPPPTGLARKKMPATIVIFPLHTLDQGTSTDDLMTDFPPLAELSVATSSIAEEIAVPTVALTPGAATTNAVNTGRVPIADSALEAIQKELTKSSNPLSTLYHHFFPYLSVLSRHHLMAAASGVTCDRSAEVDVATVTSKAAPTYSTKSLAALFEIVHEEVSKLEYTSYGASEALYSVEETMNNLIVVANSGRGVDDSFYETLKEASR